MRIDSHLPTLIVVAVLGAALIGCQRQANHLTGDSRVPLLHGDGFSVPPMGIEKPAGPGANDGLPPGHPPIPLLPPGHPPIQRPNLIVA